MESSSPDDCDSRSVYNRVFWLAYLANTLLVTANSLTFRFAELVNWLGGNEKIAGTIVSVGVVGAIAFRFVLGQAIDRFGIRRLWLLTSAAFIAGNFCFLADDAIGAALYGGRILFAAGLAGMFTCSIVHIQNRVEVHRRTEVVGILGTSGFVGMILGTRIGDSLFRAEPNRELFADLFGGVVLLAVVYAILVALITHGDVYRRPSRTVPTWRLLFRYWPGPVVVAAMLMGVCFTGTSVFLTRLATNRGLPGIGTFWTAYAIVAFLMRFAARSWGRTIGRDRMIVLGLLGHSIGNGLLVFVTSDWHFLAPACFCGLGHALLFPAIVSLGAGSFPKRYRGIGTTVVLGFLDLGAAASAPVLGWIIDATAGGAGFSGMYLTVCGLCLVTSAWYQWVARPDLDPELLSSQPARKTSGVRQKNTSNPVSCP